jgi:choline-sulfatase
MLDFAGAADLPMGQPVDGRSLAPMARGGDADDGVVIGEYCAEMTAMPVFMIRRGPWKYVHCDDDPAQLYNLQDDPCERTNLASDPACADIVAGFAAEVMERWDSAALRDDVIASQTARRVVFTAMQTGRRTDWDYSPPRNAAEEYVRNHIDWTAAAARTRLPPLDE